MSDEWAHGRALVNRHPFIGIVYRTSVCAPIAVQIRRFLHAIYIPSRKISGAAQILVSRLASKRPYLSFRQVM